MLPRRPHAHLACGRRSRLRLDARNVHVIEPRPGKSAGVRLRDSRRNNTPPRQADLTRLDRLVLHPPTTAPTHKVELVVEVVDARTLRVLTHRHGPEARLGSYPDMSAAGGRGARARLAQCLLPGLLSRLASTTSYLQGAAARPSPLRRGGRRRAVRSTAGFAHQGSHDPPAGTSLRPGRCPLRGIVRPTRSPTASRRRARTGCRRTRAGRNSSSPSGRRPRRVVPTREREVGSVRVGDHPSDSMAAGRSASASRPAPSAARPAGRGRRCASRAPKRVRADRRCAALPRHREAGLSPGRLRGASRPHCRGTAAPAGGAVLSQAPRLERVPLRGRPPQGLPHGFARVRATRG